MLKVLKQPKAKLVFLVRRYDIDKNSANVNESAPSMLIKLNLLLISDKATADRRVSFQLTNARSHLGKTRVSDGFVQT